MAKKKALRQTPLESYSLAILAIIFLTGFIARAGPFIADSSNAYGEYDAVYHLQMGYKMSKGEVWGDCLS